MARTTLAGAALLLLAGCVTMGRYDPEYFAAWPISPEMKLEGRALIRTAPEEDAFVYSGRPVTFTGSAITLRLPLGVATREAAVRVFGDLFRGGAAASSDGGETAGYRVVISPRVTGFRHACRWSLFAPRVFTVSVAVAVQDGEGHDVLARTYDSGEVAVDNVAVRKREAEAVSRTVQMALQALMLRAAADVKAALEGAPAPAAAPPDGVGSAPARQTAAAWPVVSGASGSENPPGA
jgi:hypothetical protein